MVMTMVLIDSSTTTKKKDIKAMQAFLKKFQKKSKTLVTN